VPGLGGVRLKDRSSTIIGYLANVRLRKASGHFRSGYRSKGVEVGAFDFFGLNVKVAHGDVWPAVAEGLDDYAKIGAESDGVVQSI